MKRFIVIFVWILCTSTRGADRHLVLVSIDGLSPYFYLDPERYGLKIPHLRSLVRSGVAAEGMRGVYPSVTYPSHATLVTGVRPAKHGVLTNWRTDGSWYLHSSDIRTETLWDVARASDLSTAIVTWPSSYGAAVDYLIPENLTTTEGNVLALIREGATPGLFEEMEPTIGPFGPLLPFEDLEAGVPLDTMTADCAAEIILRKKPNLMALHFLDLDHRRHSFGPLSEEAIRSLEFIDRQLGKIIQAVDQAEIRDKTTFVIVSDHGQVAVHTAINLEAIRKVLLANASSLRFSLSGGSAAVYLTDALFQDQVVQSLHRYMKGRLDGIVSIVDRSELDRLGAYPDALLALEAADGYMFANDATSSQILVPTSWRGTHGYLPSKTNLLAAFIASGPGIDLAQRGRVIPVVRMLDVAPTIAALLNFELPQAEGFPIVGILVHELSQ